MKKLELTEPELTDTINLIRIGARGLANDQPNPEAIKILVTAEDLVKKITDANNSSSPSS